MGHVSESLLLFFENISYNITFLDMGVSLNGGTPKSSILKGVSIINHPVWGTTTLGNPHIVCVFQYKFETVHNHMDELLFESNPHV